MAICNLFNKLDKPTGNFMMFSQYVEDLTRYYTEGENWRVIPSRFIALDINYKNIKKSKVMPNDESLNDGIPKYFQNYFENACAYGRENYSNFVTSLAENITSRNWNANIARNLFWNSMFDGGFLTLSSYGNTKTIDEVKYWSDITLQSYDEHEGMGYGEIYCYIPTDGERMRCQCVAITDTLGNDGRRYDSSNVNNCLEGYNDKYIENYSQNYYYDRDFTMSFDDDSVSKLLNSPEQYYNINTIIVLYDVMKLVNEKWEKVYSYIPMGMYISGIFDENNNLTNSVKKYVTTSYGTGTSYGLRICTRFTVSPKGLILKDSEFTTDGDNYKAIGQLMTSMSECLNKMMEMSNNQNNTVQMFKDTIATIRNNRTNVPYVKDINGTDWWFVNGKALTPVGGSSATDNGCTQLSAEVIQKRIDNLMDNNPDNDFSYISDGTGCDCHVLSNKVLADALGVDYDGPDYGGGSTGDSNTGGSGNTIINVDYASDADVSEELWK